MKRGKVGSTGVLKMNDKLFQSFMTLSKNYVKFLNFKIPDSDFITAVVSLNKGLSGMLLPVALTKQLTK